MNRAARASIIEAIKRRDGYFCYICKNPFSAEDPPTIEHFIPLAHKGTWDLENLRIAHSKCNSMKSNLMPNSDGTVNLVRRRRRPRTARLKQCKACNNGRLLMIEEVCNECARRSQPAQTPTVYKRKPKNCAHKGLEHCWACYLGFIERSE